MIIYQYLKIYLLITLIIMKMLEFIHNLLIFNRVNKLFLKFTKHACLIIMMKLFFKN